jgi:hypothetical protein
MTNAYLSGCAFRPLPARPIRRGSSPRQRVGRPENAPASRPGVLPSRPCGCGPQLDWTRDVIATGATGQDLGKHAQLAIISRKHCSGSDAISHLHWLRSRERRGFDLNCGFRRAIDNDGPSATSRRNPFQFNQRRRPCLTRPRLLFPLPSFSAPCPAPSHTHPNIIVPTAHRTGPSFMRTRMAFRRPSCGRLTGRIIHRASIDLTTVCWTTSSTDTLSERADRGSPRVDEERRGNRCLESPNQ